MVLIKNFYFITLFLLATLFNSPLDVHTNANIPQEKRISVDNAVYLEFSSTKVGLQYNQLEKLLTEIDAIPHEIKATFKLDGMVITFGVTNIHNLSSDEFKEQIEKGFQNAIESNRSLEKDKSISLEELRDSLRFKFLSFLDTQEKISKVNVFELIQSEWFSQVHDLKVNQVLKKERDQVLEELRQQYQLDKDEK